MSVNRYTTAGGLQTLANGQRIWVGTKSAHQQEKLAGTLPKDCLVAIIDDDKELAAEDVGYNPHDIIFHTLREEYPSASDSEIETMVQQVLDGGDLSEYPTDVQEALDELYDTAVDLQDQIDYTVETTVNKNSFVYENLIPYPYYRPNIYESNGITFTVNSDGSITANGTATANAIFNLSARTVSEWYLPQGTYTLSGCPSGGATNKYYMSLGGNNAAGTGGETIANDVGGGVTFTIDSTVAQRAKQVYIQITNGQTVSNLTFKPMLVKDSEAHEYQPPTENIKNRVGILEKETAINLVPYPYYKPNVYNTNGVTFTVDENGVITANGTATAYTAFTIRSRANAPYMYLKEGTYTISGCTGGGSNKYRIQFSGTDAQGNAETFANQYNDPVTFTISAEQAQRPKQFTVNISQGATVNNVKFYPMLELGFVKHDYVPTVTPQVFDLYENKMDKSGGTFTGDVTIAPTNQGADLYIGEHIVNGQGGSLHIYGKDATSPTTNVNRKVRIHAGTKLTADRGATFPDVSGEFAINTNNNANYVYTPTVIEVTPQVGTKVKCGYFKCGYLVTFFFNLSSVPTGTNTICTLPAGYRPYADVQCDTALDDRYFVVNTDGSVKIINNKTSAADVTGYCTFIACN